MVDFKKHLENKLAKGVTKKLIASKICLENVMKVADIHSNSLSEFAVDVIIGNRPEYADMGDMNENLYSIEDIQETHADPGGTLPAEVQEELRQIIELCTQNDCAYVRIVNS